MAKDSGIQALVESVREELADIARQAEAQASWSLELPVAVIDARKPPTRVYATAIGTIGSVLRISRTVDHPLIQQLFVLHEEIGPEPAIEALLNGADGEEFAELWEEYREEAKGELVWGANDAAAFVTKSKACHQDHELALVALVPGHLYSCGIPIRSLTA
ncbi:hypothetical protein [Synechococcus sp. LTW-G]